MAGAASTGSISDEERRWAVTGVCLTKGLTPALRKALATELQKWYHRLCQAPDEIDMQVFLRFKKKLPPSKFQLQYKNINNNNVHKSPSAYDYAVKDPLSLAKLFVQPFMAMFTGFDQSMDMSAVLAVMCEADPFVASGAAADAKTVRSDIRNKWAHCNFSDWTEPTFLAALRGMQSLVKKINLSPADQKALCDSLDDWKDKGLQLCFGQPVNSDLLKFVTEEVAELCTSVKTWKFDCDTQISEVLTKLDSIQSNFDKQLREVLCRTGKVEELASENAKGLKRHSEEFERLDKKWTEDHDKQKENYSEFAVKKAPYGLRKLPRYMVERRSEVDKVLGLLMEGNKVGVIGSLSVEVIGIRGMGGLGKTVLAQAVALHVSKSRQVIWFDIGETPDRLALINILIKVLGGAGSFSDIRAAQAWLIANTSDKDCLVVLDDVWSVDDAAVFDHLSGKCQLLITTRDANVVGGLGGSAYELETMAADRSRALLYKYACVTPDEQSKLSSNMQGIVSKLLDQCGGLPLALSLVGSNLKDTRVEQAWRDILQDFEKADLEKLRSLFPTDAYPHPNLLAAIDVSFQRLEESAREKFLDFAIFPEDTDIPLDILELFWSSTGTENGRISCNSRESRDILAVLERKSLIQKGIHGEEEIWEGSSIYITKWQVNFSRACVYERRDGTMMGIPACIHFSHIYRILLL